MISKVNTILDKSVRNCDLQRLRDASNLGCRLTNIALDLSIQPERSMPWKHVAYAFDEIGTSGLSPSSEDFKDFFRAAKEAYRMEVLVRYGIDASDRHIPCERPLITIKFFRKDKREEFYGWNFSVGFMFRIHSFGVSME